MFDWKQIANVNFDDQRRAKLGLKTGRQMFEESYQQMAKAEKASQERAQIEPLIKAQLLNAMVNRHPIQVVYPIKNPTETIGGASEEDDDDGFYSINKSETSSSATFVETIETIPAGTQLLYKAWDKQMGQWIFTGSNKREYAIYDKPLIMFQNKMIENPGFFGLLHNTNLKNLILKEI